jgi:hypothetical protein
MSSVVNSSFREQQKAGKIRPFVAYRFFHPPRRPGAPADERGDGLSLITPPNSWPPSRIDFGL